MQSETSTSRPDKGAARALWLCLLCLFLIRAITALVPSMWAWGLNVLRFMTPLAAWLPWTLGAMFLLRALGARGERFLAEFSDRLLKARLAPWLVALAAGGIVWSLPDRTWLTGDFLLRQGLAERGAFAGNLSHSLPLEVLLNFTIPRAFESFSHLDPNVANRLIGAIAAAALGLCSLALAREWGFTESAAGVAAGTIWFGGYLTVFTGLGKPAAMLCVLTAMSVLGATRLVDSMRGGWLIGASVGSAFVTHRSGLALAPLWIACVVLAARKHQLLGWRSRMELGTAAGLPIIGGIIALPMVWRIFFDFDLPRHFLTASVRKAGFVSTAFAPMHLIDLANLLLLYTPAIVSASIVVIADRRDSLRGLSALLLVILLLSFAPLLLFIHPIQGVFRDLEVFAPAGLASALLAAFVLGRGLQERRLASWLSPVLIASVLVPSLQWLLQFHDPVRGLRRARMFAIEMPARAPDELAQLWDLLAYRAFRLQEWSLAVEASEQSVRYAPNERAKLMLAVARTYVGKFGAAETVYVELADRFPADPLVWVGLCGVAFRLGDSLQVQRSLPKVRAFLAQPQGARLIQKHLSVFPQVWPSREQLPQGAAP